MSETTEPAPAPEPIQTPPDAEPPPPAPETPPAVETPPPSPEAAAEPPAEPKPKPQDRRFANMTAKLRDESAARERAEVELAAARAMLAVRNDGTDTPPAPAAPDIESRVAQTIAEREFNRRLSEIDTTGKAAIGSDVWEAAKETLTSLGATRNPNFLAALAETDHPAQIFAALAEDTDALLELLDKPPAAMATRLGRMDAKLGTPKAPSVSQAPPPAPRVGGTQVVPEPSIYDEKLSMREWAAQWDKYAKANGLPAHLGGGGGRR